MTSLPESCQNLLRHGFLTDLAEFRPELAGGLPLGLVGPRFSLEIACFSLGAEAFVDRVIALYADYPRFVLFQEDDRVFCRFECEGFPVELSAEATGADEHSRLRWFALQRRLLRVLGEDFRAAVCAYGVREGKRLEATFAAVLGFTGPALLSLGEDCSDEVLLSHWSSRSRSRGDFAAEPSAQ